jgi:hypothetical protein
MGRKIGRSLQSLNRRSGRERSNRACENAGLEAGNPALYILSTRDERAGWSGRVARKPEQCACERGAVMNSGHLVRTRRLPHTT